jgi:hypothetical protein
MDWSLTNKVRDVGRTTQSKWRGDQTAKRFPDQPVTPERWRGNEGYCIGLSFQLGLLVWDRIHRLGQPAPSASAGNDIYDGSQNILTP